MNIKSLLAAVTMVGSAALCGCSHAAPVTIDPAVDEAAETNDAPVGEAAAAETANWYSSRSWGWSRTTTVARPVTHSYYSRTYAHFGPPAARHEVIGRAPSANHFWMPGYYRYGNSRYSWVGGRWGLRRPGYHYVAGHWDNVGGYWHYVPAAWRR